jgi:heat shock protein HslJ
MLIRQLALAAVILLSMVLTACGGARGGAGTPDLNGTQWVLTSLNGSSPVEGTTITLNFEIRDGESSVGGSAGCNSYGGSYEQDGESLSFGMLFSTMMACEQPIMDQETGYLGTLETITGFTLEGGQLQMWGESTALVFSPAE